MVVCWLMIVSGGIAVGVDCVGGVGDDIVGVEDDDDDDSGKMQEPELGLVLIKVAASPKSQLVGAGLKTGTGESVGFVGGKGIADVGEGTVTGIAAGFVGEIVTGFHGGYWVAQFLIASLCTCFCILFAYATRRSLITNCNQCSCNFFCSSLTNTLYGCT